MLDWAGLGWTGLDWAGLGWTGLDNLSDSAGHAYEVYFKKTHPDPTGSGFVRPSPARQDFESVKKLTFR